MSTTTNLFAIKEQKNDAMIAQTWLNSPYLQTIPVFTYCKYVGTVWSRAQLSRVASFIHGNLQKVRLVVVKVTSGSTNRASWPWYTRYGWENTTGSSPNYTGSIHAGLDGLSTRRLVGSYPPWYNTSLTPSSCQWYLVQIPSPSTTSSYCLEHNITTVKFDTALLLHDHLTKCDRDNKVLTNCIVL